MTQNTKILHCCTQIEPDALVSVLRTAGQPAIGPASRSESTYYDTFDWRLFDRGFSLAVRKEPGGAETDLFEQGTASPLVAAAGGLHSGFAEDIPSEKLRTVIAPLIDVRRLLPRLVVAAETLPVTLCDDDTKTVLRVRLEQITCRRPDSEDERNLGSRIVLEPIRGYGQHLAAAEEAVEELIGSDRESAPLAVAAMRALGLEPGDYSSKLKLDLDETMSAGEAARRIHLTLLDTMERNEEGTAHNVDSEFLHDFRVAIRRTRSALGLVDKGVLPPDVIAREKEDFRWVGQCTNRMRDLDVYQIAVPDYQATLLESYRPALDPFRDHLARQSRRESRRVAAMIKGKRYREIRDRWRKYLTTTKASPEDGPEAMRPARDLASQRIWKTYRKMMKEGAAIDDDSPNSALHELRLTGKKLRYLLEFFQSLYPNEELAMLIGAMKGLQNVLGEFQDTEVQSHAIHDFAAEMAKAGVAPVETQMAMGMVADSILRRQAAARGAFHDRFEEFSDEEVQESFRRLFKS